MTEFFSLARFYLSFFDAEFFRKWTKKKPEVIAEVHQNSHRKQLVVVLRSTFASRVDREFFLL